MVQRVKRRLVIATMWVKRSIKMAYQSFVRGFWGAIGGSAAAGLVWLATKWLMAMTAP